MAKIIDCKETMDTMEYNLAKLKFVQEKYPNMKLQENGDNYMFSDKTVGAAFTKTAIEHVYHDELRLRVYDEMEFRHNGKGERITIDAIPRTCKIAYVHRDWQTKKSTIRFARPLFKIKGKNASDLGKALYKDVCIAILEFIKNRPGIEINKDGLDPRLKKLIIFS